MDEAQGAHDFALGNGHEMGRGQIVFVVLFLFGDLLFPDENLAPQRKGGVAEEGERRDGKDDDIGHGADPNRAATACLGPRHTNVFEPGTLLSYYADE